MTTNIVFSCPSLAKQNWPRHATTCSWLDPRTWCLTMLGYNILVMVILAIKMSVSLPVWFLSLFCVGLLVHHYHVSVQKNAQQEEIVRLQADIAQLQEMNQHLRDGNKVWYFPTIAYRITSVLTGVVTGAPTSLYQGATYFLHQLLGIDLPSSSIPKIEGKL